MNLNLVINNEFIKQNNARILSAFEIQPSYVFKKEEKLEKDEFLEKVKDVLSDIYSRFYVSKTQRANDLELNSEFANKIYKWIEKVQFVEEIAINLTGKRGGLSKYHSLTKKGANYIGKEPAKRYAGGVGPKHFFIQRYLKKHLPALGFSEIKVEKELSGKRIDLFCNYGELKVAIEICVSTIKTEHLNAIKDLDKCDVLLIACPDKKTQNKLEKEIYKNIPKNPKIKICVVHELLNKPKELIDSR